MCWQSRLTGVLAAIRSCLSVDSYQHSAVTNTSRCVPSPIKYSGVSINCHQHWNYVDSQQDWQMYWQLLDLASILATVAFQVCWKRPVLAGVLPRHAIWQAGVLLASNPYRFVASHEHWQVCCLHAWRQTLWCCGGDQQAVVLTNDCHKGKYRAPLNMQVTQWFIIADSGFGPLTNFPR